MNPDFRTSFWVFDKHCCVEEIPTVAFCYSHPLYSEHILHVTPSPSQKKSNNIFWENKKITSSLIICRYVMANVCWSDRSILWQIYLYIYIYSHYNLWTTTYHIICFVFLFYQEIHHLIEYHLLRRQPRLLRYPRFIW